MGGKLRDPICALYRIISNINAAELVVNLKASYQRHAYTCMQLHGALLVQLIWGPLGGQYIYSYSYSFPF